MKNHQLKRCLLSKMNSFDYNSLKPGHIINYHNVFFKFENGPYLIMPSGVIALNDSSLFMRIWQQRGPPCPMDTFLVHNIFKSIQNLS